MKRTYETKGIVKFFNTERSFGIILPEYSIDVYFNGRDLRSVGYLSLEPETKIKVLVERDGHQARVLKFIEINGRPCVEQAFSEEKYPPGKRPLTDWEKVVVENRHQSKGKYSLSRGANSMKILLDETVLKKFGIDQVVSKGQELLVRSTNLKIRDYWTTVAVEVRLP